MTEPLLLLPGMMCDERLFSPQCDYFSSDRQVLIGNLTKGDSVTSIANNVLNAAPERFALAGLSMGGIVAMEIWRLAPERVTRLALLDTNPRAETPEVQLSREPQMAAASNGQLEKLCAEQVIPKYFSPSLNKQKKNELTNLCIDMVNTLGPEVFIQQSIALKNRPDQQATLQTVTVPTLVLMGQDDIVCPLDRHQLMTNLILNASLTLIPNAGHIPCLEQPQATNFAFKQWLSA